MAAIPTVKVKHPTLGAVVINESDFNPEVHERYVEGDALSAPPTAKSSVVISVPALDEGAVRTVLANNADVLDEAVANMTGRKPRRRK
jgi:hypothetical protein